MHFMRSWKGAADTAGFAGMRSGGLDVGYVSEAEHLNWVRLRP